MKYTAIALILFAAASSAAAADAGSPSLLRCGVMFGGKSLTYDAAKETNDKRYQRLNALPATAAAEPLRFGPSAAAAERAADTTPFASGTPDKRLPVNLTLATFGCAW